MKNKKIISHNEAETIEIGKNIASKLQKGDIIILTGDLGSGKTKFTQGILTYFHIENERSSPTFTLVNEYISNDTKIYHFDVYRLSDSSEFYEIGGEEYFENGICIIEGGEIIQDVLPNEYIKIKFSRDETNENLRTLDITTFGNKFDNIF